WEFYALRLDVLRDARPNAAHRALAELEADGLLQAVITQNVDRLHVLAGSRDVIEVHGSIGRGVCPACGWETDDVATLLPLPRCACRRRVTGWPCWRKGAASRPRTSRRRAGACATTCGRRGSAAVASSASRRSATCSSSRAQASAGARSSTRTRCTSRRRTSG